jgi:recombinational DNA repair protein (RecF pathway)
MSLIKTEAILLRASNYRDKSKIITLYTKSHGKLTAVAKGVRDAKTKWGGVLQSMAFLNILLYYKENRSLHLLSNAEYVKSYNGIYGNFDKMNVGFRIIELINKTTVDRHEIKGLYELLTGCLNKLNDATKNYVNVLFNFEFRLAKLLGFAIDVENGTSGVPQGYLGFEEIKMQKDDLAFLRTVAGGNFDEIMNLNIVKSTEVLIDRYLESHFKVHFDNLDFSNTKKVIFSKEMRYSR